MLKNGDISEDWPVRASDLNQQHKTTYFRTGDEQDEEPYPLHVTLKAFVSIGANDAKGTEDDPYIWKGPSTATAYEIKNMYDVDIVEREELEKKTNDESAPLSYVYTIAIPSSVNVADTLYVSGVPHEVLVFVDDAETGDQFTAEAFRHYIGIPDDVFPKGAWRNVEDEEE